ncbi:MAG: glycosyltransferase family 4 protein, partial [Rhodospirillaceae bacterium]|nr:glycosyltransferase family 4 protein [Rhodospirillaceae bacterium]
MKILFLTENFPPETNAAATRVYERACYWIEAGHQVTVLTCAPNFPQGRLLDGYQNRWRQVEDMSGIRVVRVKSYITANEGIIRRTLDFVSFMMTAFFFGLFEKKPDVIAATSPQFFAAVAGWMLAGCRRRPFVFELGDLWPASIIAVGAMKDNLLLRLMERLELFLYRRSAAIAALTHAFKDNLVSRDIAPDKIAVVINGVDLKRYAPTARDADLAVEYDLADKFVIGYGNGGPDFTIDTSGNVGFGATSMFTYGSSTLTNVQISNGGYSVLTHQTTSSAANGGVWRNIVRSAGVYQIQAMNDLGTGEVTALE